MIDDMIEVKADQKTMIELSIFTDRVVNIDFKPKVKIEGEEDEIIANEGDYIIRDTNGRIYLHQEKKRQMEIVECFQFYEDPIPDWFMDKVTKDEIRLFNCDHSRFTKEEAHAIVYREDGSFMIFGGDYITIGADGNIYPCTKEIYDKVKRGGMENDIRG